MKPLTVTYAEQVPSVANAREHWSDRARRAKRHRNRARLELRALCVGSDFAGQLRITLTRFGTRDLDGDNLQSAMKATRDGVADWLGADDSDARLTWVYEQARAKAQAVRIHVEAA